MSNKATIKAYNSNVQVWHRDVCADITCTGDEPQFPLDTDYSDEDMAITNSYELSNYLSSLSDEELAQWLEEQACY